MVRQRKPKKVKNILELKILFEDRHPEEVLIEDEVEVNNEIPDENKNVVYVDSLIRAKDKYEIFFTNIQKLSHYIINLDHKISHTISLGDNLDKDGKGAIKFAQWYHKEYKEGTLGYHVIKYHGRNDVDKMLIMRIRNLNMENYINKKSNRNGEEITDYDQWN